MLPEVFKKKKKSFVFHLLIILSNTIAQSVCLVREFIGVKWENNKNKGGIGSQPLSNEASNKRHFFFASSDALCFPLKDACEGLKRNLSFAK